MRAIHLTMQLARCGIPSFPQDSLRHQWEQLRGSFPLTPAVTQAIAGFVKARPQDGTTTLSPRQRPAVQARNTTPTMGSRTSGGWANCDPAQFRVSCNV